MSYTTIKNEISTQLKTVTGIGRVYDYKRLRDNLAEIKDELTLGRILHTWWITRVEVPAEANTYANVYRNHEWHLIGFYQVDDSSKSEITFQQLVDDVMNKFDTLSNLDLNNTADQWPAAEMLEFVEVKLAGTLCHRAIIKIVTSEEVNP